MKIARDSPRSVQVERWHENVRVHCRCGPGRSTGLSHKKETTYQRYRVFGRSDPVAGRRLADCGRAPLEVDRTDRLTVLLRRSRPRHCNRFVWQSFRHQLATGIVFLWTHGETLYRDSCAAIVFVNWHDFIWLFHFSFICFFTTVKHDKSMKLD